MLYKLSPLVPRLALSLFLPLLEKRSSRTPLNYVICPRIFHEMFAAEGNETSQTQIQVGGQDLTEPTKNKKEKKEVRLDGFSSWMTRN